MSLRCGLANSPLDSLLCNFGRRIFDGQKIKILLRYLQLTVAREDVGIFVVFDIQRSQLPVFCSLALGIIEVDDLAEDGDFFDKVLQRSGVDRESGLSLCRIFCRSQVCSFLLLKFFGPNADNLLQLRACQVAERSVSS